MTEPCGWTPVTACCSGWSGISEEIRNLVTPVAVDILWRMSGMRFSVCERVIRPCGESCQSSTYLEATSHQLSPSSNGSGWNGPYIQGGSWFNAMCGCPSGCECNPISKVSLPGPVASITKVLLDGVTLSAVTDYKLQDGKLLRLGGFSWPSCQRMDLASTEDNTWEVTYQYGIPVPPSGNLAAGVLACELAKGCTGQNCRIPGNVIQRVREGDTIMLRDPIQLYQWGLLGISEVDMFIKAVNPHNLKSPPRVWSPDLPQHRSG